MDDLEFSIVFKRRNKKIWVLRCDYKTFDSINTLINYYLIKGSYCD